VRERACADPFGDRISSSTAARDSAFAHPEQAPTPPASEREELNERAIRRHRIERE
jgi:hypothetical protein